MNVLSDKTANRARSGVVLVWALITMAVTTTILGGLAAYYTNVGRLARFYQSHTATDFAAWAEIDQRIHANIDENLEQLSAAQAIESLSSALSGGAASVATPNSSTDVKLETRMKDASGDYVSVDATAIKAALSRMQAGTKTEFEVVSTATTSTHGGIPTATRSVREVIEVEKWTKGFAGAETMPVFNYVYFANNYGHLDSSVVANGDIGANDKFTIDGTRVNGYVNVRGSSSNDTGAVVLQNSPKMWPYHSYMSRVVEKVDADLALAVPGYQTEGIDYYTQIRPTNPIYISESSNIVWNGGYEPPGYVSQYGEVLSSGKLAKVPTNPFTEVVAKYSGENEYTKLYHTYYTDDNKKKKNDLQDEYEQFYDSNGNLIRPSGETQYLKFYTKDGKAKSNEYEADYIKYYDKATGNPKPYEHQTELDQLEVERGTYFSSDYYYNKYQVDKTNPYNDSSKGISEKYSSYWTKDRRGNETQITKNPYNKNKEKAKYDEWNNGKAAWAKPNGEKYKAYHAWENGKTDWARGGSKRTQYDSYKGAASTWSEKQEKAKKDYDGWNSDKTKYDASSEKKEYEQWKTDVVPWQTNGEKLTEYLAWNTNQTDAKTKYDGWNAAKAKASSDFADWQKTFEDWLNNLSTSGEEVDLNWQTAHLSVTNTGKVETMLSKRIISVSTNFVEVPKMSDGQAMSDIIEFCKTNKTTTGRIGGYLQCYNRCRPDRGAEFDISITNVYAYHWEYYRSGLFASDANRLIEPIIHRGVTRTLSAVLVEKGDGTSTAPFRADEGNAAFASVAELEKGSVILIGTEDFPIVIDGPVYFSGDVLIRGFVSGHGTIYAGRNVHILGDITYLNPPNWPHKNLSEAKNHPQTTAERNRYCDLLMLVARGNIIVGDYTSEVWQSDANMMYLKGYGETSVVCNEFAESAIGYETGFCRDYTEDDGGKKVETSYIDKSTSGIGYKNYPLRAWTKDESTLQVKKVNRKYYESLFGEKVISGLKQTVSTDPADAWKTSSSIWQRIKALLLGGDVTTQAVTDGQSASAADITEIDAALVANHGIFGVVGGDGMPQFTLNGTMVCRDEGLLPSFSTRFSGFSQRKVWLNWDMRLKTTSAEGVLLGAPQRLVDNMDEAAFRVRVKSRTLLQ